MRFKIVLLKGEKFKLSPVTGLRGQWIVRRQGDNVF
jgi:hypothetical protein